MEKKRKFIWIYVALAFLMFIPLYTEKPYDPRQTTDVIKSLLMVVTDPYAAFAPIFHIGTIVLVILMILLREKSSRIFTGYFGVNFLVIAFVNSIGSTEKYGRVVMTSTLVLCLIIGILWVIETFRPKTTAGFKGVLPYKYFFLPLPLLVFWSPFNAQVKPDFNPALLLNAPSYGMTFCFTMPVFLFFLILFHPKVNVFSLKITSFIGLMYGLVNMQWFFTPGMSWMGILHLPLLILSLYGMLLRRNA
ncbi:hypothetical protein COY52_09165 [Candidatus Desantisbacteria bacterium CG_4_10_14_0_8_um_filter_48_22]|uniref:Uncharacterized protein n=1 Tax=Candidatus Desantisbacteria bacterium CG_4_10_14_0_8_um_filter_48_22 TaxID=1974543 RepID=A0A2M7S8K9_9BACT|nr:MAG: hypothetical protein COS16_05555 [Candidatus Desantisbacteria bacterium CG02_land_8_20_14_3_00_49_13]PIZ15663.1 MAG: hypothetical protein COY52_09165 [Candidatus Desantisbacteria bacterium CG_4_10_14_0_8_um_filter_48_22]